MDSRTHKILTSVASISASMAGFTITTNCHAYMIENKGTDNCKVYFNSDTDNYYTLNAGESLPMKNDSTQEMYKDTIKITFDSLVSPLATIVKQNKTLIV